MQTGEYALGEGDSKGGAGEEDSRGEEGLPGDKLFDQDEKNQDDRAATDRSPNDGSAPGLLVA